MCPDSESTSQQVEGGVLLPLQVDKVNTQVASDLVETLVGWEAFDEVRQQLMVAQLTRIAAAGPSEDVMEAVRLALDEDSGSSE